MTTDVLAEDRKIVEFGVVRGRPSTFTEGVDDAEVIGTSADADTWLHLDCAPPRHSTPGMAVYEFSKNIWTVPNVVAVTHGVDRGVQLVWTVLTTRDKNTRRQIYEHERALMAAYPDLVFNFHVTALDQGAGVSFMRDVDSRVVMLRSFEQ